jgi:hypothetical protein
MPAVRIAYAAWKSHYVHIIKEHTFNFGLGEYLKVEMVL